jgi:Tol biopolymer transport system component/DNA-binding winged helix-turn-helix (wHTH) protein
MTRDKSFVFRFAEIEVREREFSLFKAGEVFPVEPKAFRVLLILLRNPQKLISKEEILNEVWGDTAVTENSLARSIALIRRLLGDETRNPRYIETVATVGYRFICKVEASEDVIEDLPVTGITSRSTPEGPLALVTSPIRDWETSDPTRRTQGFVRRNRVRIGALAAAILIVLTICVAFWRTSLRTPIVTNAVELSNDGRAKVPMNLPVTDGVHLYFVEGTPWTTGSGIAQMSAMGGETTWITTSLREVLAIYAISPDGSKLMVVNGVAMGSEAAGEVWVQPLPAGSPYRVGNLIAASACWTPDGKHIVYSYAGVISIANEDGSDPHPLAKVSGIVRGFRFSPDGRRIRFYIIQSNGESSSIWEMDARGNRLHALLPNWTGSPYQCCGNWSRDGNYYYFQAGRGNDQAIWVIPERYSIFGKSPAIPSRLTTGPLIFSAPLPSSDGKRLFVVGEESRVELFRYDLFAGRSDPFLPGFSAGPVDFSQDRKWMAYISYPDLTLWRSRVDGTDKMQLTFPPARAYLPRWSPDGSRIVYMDVQPNRPWKISLISSSGGIPKSPLQSEPDDAETDPTWTPDGKSIIFGRSEWAGAGKPAIYRLDLSSGKASSIPESDGLFSPRVSPNGRYISALTRPQTAVMLFDTTTNHWSKLAEGESFSFNLWSHDSKYVYVREQFQDHAELVRVQIQDRTMQRVLNLKDIPQLVDPFAAWIGLTPDDQPLLMRDRSVQEIYALGLEEK